MRLTDGFQLVLPTFSSARNRSARQVHLRPTLHLGIDGVVSTKTDVCDFCVCAEPSCVERLLSKEWKGGVDCLDGSELLVEVKGTTLNANTLMLPVGPGTGENVLSVLTVE